MNKTGCRRSFLCVAALAAALALPASAFAAAAATDTRLAPEDRHEDISVVITQFIQKSHFNHLPVNDELSSKVMDGYLDALDRHKLYLLESDVEFFDRYRTELDDIVRNSDESLTPVFEMFEIYRTRVRERLTFALESTANGTGLHGLRDLPI